MRQFVIAVIGIIVTLSLGFPLAQGASASEQQHLLTAGEKAPDFSLPDQDGKIHRLSDYKGKSLVLAFYPADFTKGCTLEAHVNNEHIRQCQEAGLTLIGISVQTSASHKAFCQTYGIRYTLLADTKGETAARYGVLGAPFAGRFPKRAWYANPRQSAKTYYKLNPGSSIGLAKRVTFIVGKNGKIAYVDADVNSHLATCAKDWINWVKAHEALLNAK